MRLKLCLVLGALAGWLLSTGAIPARSAPSLTDFGYGSFDRSGVPILVVLGEFAGFPPLTHNAAYFQNLVFNANHYPSVNGFFLENSLGRFQWRPAGSGVIGPIYFSYSESFWGVGTNDPPYLSNIVHRVMTSGLFNFATCDTDGDNVIESNELFILFVSNFGGGAKRATGAVKPAGSVYTVDTLMALVAEHGEFSTLTHELAHLVHAVDLYGQNGNDGSNQGLTTMGATIIFTDYPDLWFNTNKWDSMKTFHLDPWHKLHLAWCEPRLVSINAGGTFDLPTTQLRRSDGPILLYEPGRTQEFFLVEYRNRTSSNGIGYDADVGDTGIAIWHVVPEIPPGVFNESPPSLSDGGTMLWKGDTLTPKLQWQDGSSTLTRLYISPFGTNDDSVRVEVRVDRETWVDFNYAGPVEVGTFDSPFNTLAEGLGAAGWGGAIWFKPGSSSEAALIRMRTTLRAYQGTATLGTR